MKRKSIILNSLLVSILVVMLCINSNSDLSKYLRTTLVAVDHGSELEHMESALTDQLSDDAELNTMINDGLGSGFVIDAKDNILANDLAPGNEINILAEDSESGFLGIDTEEVSEETAEEVSEETAEEVSEEATEETSEEATEETSEEATEETSEEATEEIAEEATEEIAEEATEKTSEEAIKKSKYNYGKNYKSPFGGKFKLKEDTPKLHGAAISEYDYDLTIILDASRSMKTKYNESTRIDEAKKLINNIVSELPEDVLVGLRVYGNKHHSQNADITCSDSKLLIPHKDISTKNFKDTLDNLTLKGSTPLTYSLLQTHKDLLAREELKHAIVLISDGLDTCGKDPITAMEEFKKENLEIKLYTVDFDVDEDVSKTLKLMSNLGKGENIKLSDASVLVSNLNELFNEDDENTLAITTDEGAADEGAADEGAADEGAADEGAADEMTVEEVVIGDETNEDGDESSVLSQLSKGSSIIYIGYGIALIVFITAFVIFIKRRKQHDNEMLIDTLKDIKAGDLNNDVEEPVVETTEEPVVEITEEPVVETTEEPVVETTEEPVVETTEEPVVETTEEPVVETTEEPVVETTEEPVVETAEEPVVETAEEPVVETAEEPKEIPQIDKDDGQKFMDPTKLNIREEKKFKSIDDLMNE